MLRASADHNDVTVDLAGIRDATIDSGVPHGHALIALTDAVVLRDVDERQIAFGALVGAVGEQAAVRAAAVAGNFEMMNRLLDGIGVGAPPGAAPIAAEIGVSVW
ncbi:MAG: hypothetical protein OES57_17785 [Acidimicrobiia bacterium]|nr:hypothetical protein [Acidimicrobiia bacterium]